MVKDTDISKTFGIPTRMIQRWKEGKGYRLKIYYYLKHQTAKQFEAFDNFMPEELHRDFNAKNPTRAEVDAEKKRRKEIALKEQKE